MDHTLEPLILQYKNDPESVYHTWFLHSEERLKAFRTIKSGLAPLIRAIEDRTFGNDFKGSPLETIITAISEQKQVFEGAAHAFFWKPKLRIPDIYEDEHNQLAFGRFLKACLQATREEQMLEEIIKLDQLQIKGLGPAVANILYFLQPAWFPPFNTAIVRGFNSLFAAKVKLGSWSAYLDMREALLKINDQYKLLLSKDLGAVAGLLFEAGSGRYVTETNAELIAQQEQGHTKQKLKRHQEILLDVKEGSEHSEMQHELARLGRALGYNVWIARNDHSREWQGKKLGEFSLSSLPLPEEAGDAAQTIGLIDVLWLDEAGGIISAFEVEKSTSIYSGILRLHDLSNTLGAQCRLFLIAPDGREKEIRAQLLRPAFRQNESLDVRYMLFSDLRGHCDAMCKFGSNVSILDRIERTV